MAVIDYAEPILEIKRLVNSMEKELLQKNWEQASVNLMTAIVELRVLKSNIRLLQENNGVPYQT